jgi:hypothetical protein
MSLPQLTFALVGTQEYQGDVLFGDFREFCGCFAACLRRVERIVAGGAVLRYRVSQLKSGSAALTLVPVPGGGSAGPDIPQTVADLFQDTVASLEAGGPIEPRLTSDDLRAFRKLAEPLDRRLRQVRIGGTRITGRFIANVDRIIGSPLPSEGSVTGRLERVNLHNRNEFALYAPVAGFAVTCAFPEEMFRQVQAALRRNVTVHGALTFRSGTPFPERVQVRAMEVHPLDEELPSLQSLRGLLAGATNGLSAVAFVQANRDE